MDHSHHMVMVAEFSYWIAFTTGILSSGHCFGMCGGLVSTFFIRAGARSSLPYFIYHAARITVYALIGLMAASAGAVLVQTGVLGKAQGMLQIVAGLVVILLGLDMVGLSPIRNTLHFAPIVWVRKQFINASRSGPLLGAWIGGGLNGLIPCPMTMAMAVQATTAPSPAAGGVLLLAFGLGTLPSMVTASVLFGKLGGRARGWMLRGAALLIVVLGISTLWHGLAFYGMIGEATH